MIGAYAVHNVTIKKVTYGAWGVPSYANTTVKGRVEFKTRMVRNLDGEQVVSSASVLLGNVAIVHGDEIIYNGVTYSIIRIDEVTDFSLIGKRIYLS